MVPSIQYLKNKLLRIGLVLFYSEFASFSATQEAKHKVLPGRK